MKCSRCNSDLGSPASDRTRRTFHRVFDHQYDRVGRVLCSKCYWREAAAVIVCRICGRKERHVKPAGVADQAHKFVAAAYAAWRQAGWRACGYGEKGWPGWACPECREGR